MEPLLRKPRELWDAFKTRGGLDLSYHADMDGDVVKELVTQLGGSAAIEIEGLLDDPSLTTERFVGALMKALGPFSRMLVDLLALFEREGARTTDASLQIDFDFKNAPKLSFDLRHFRDWISSFEKVRELVTVQEWSYNQLWALRTALDSPYEWRSDGLMGAEETPAASWALEYLRSGTFTFPSLPVPSSGDAGLDMLLRHAFDVWSGVIKATIATAGTREELRERAEGGYVTDRDGGGWSPQFLNSIHSDHWGASVIGQLYHLADYARANPDFAREAASRLHAFLDSVPRFTVEEDRLIESLLEFLNLPAWQRRHELYSAWVFTLIAEALEPHQLRIHHDHGRLSFSFGGSHLATADLHNPRLHVWAELRSPLGTPSLLSRRRAIQPDYTLAADPITGRLSAVAVVECKQYREFAKKNFSHAVIDYANGRPNAAIFLASYGPARSDFLDELAPEMKARIRIFGDLRPNDDTRRTEFRDALRSSVDEWYGATPVMPHAAARIPVAANAPRGFEAVTLRWAALPRDLDLHLAVGYEGGWTDIDFRTRGSADEFPWARLDADITQGDGREEIVVAKVLDAVYRCIVVNFSEDAPLAGSGASVVLQHDGTWITINCPARGTGTFWHVFDLHGGTGRIEIVNRIAEASPVTPAA